MENRWGSLMAHVRLPLAISGVRSLLARERMLGSLPDAEDAVQETLLRAWWYLDSVNKGAPLRTPASKVCLWCGSEHRPKHFNEGTYTVVTDCDSDLRDRFALCQHLKGSKQPRLLSPTAK